MTRKTWKNTLVLIIIASGMAALIISLVIDFSNQESANPLQDPSAFQLMSLQSVLPQALELAKEWREDAYLVMAVFSVKPKPSQLPPTVYFRFEAENAPLTYRIVFEGIDGERKVKVEEGQYDERLDFPPSPKIDIESILMDSIQAFEFLHINGGSDFVAKYGDQEFYVSLFLQVESSTKSRWRAYYRLEPGPSWHIKMNAYTNELLAPSIHE